MKEKIMFLNFKKIFSLIYCNNGSIDANNDVKIFYENYETDENVLLEEYKNEKFYMYKLNLRSLNQSLLNCGDYLFTEEMYDEFEKYVKELEIVLKEIEQFDETFFTEILEKVKKHSLDAIEFVKRLEYNVNGKPSFFVNLYDRRSDRPKVILMEKATVHRHDDYNEIKEVIQLDEL